MGSPAAPSFGRTLEQETEMPQGHFLTIGLNSVDPVHYQGWSGDLNACEADAKDVAAIAQSTGHSGQVMLTSDATRGAVTDALSNAAKALQAGDHLVLFYSGHGGQLPDQNGDEDDGLDETWCLYDGQFVDDELYVALSAFKPGVRIFVMSDSCHSGTVLKTALMEARPTRRAPPARAMPMNIALSVYEAHRPMYDKILGETKGVGPKDTRAEAILISGCMDNQLSADGPFNGRFTGEMKRKWNGGKFAGDYLAFWKAIVKDMPSDQTPNYFTIGPKDAAFETSKPFSIAP